tara:strand:+ start:496 stop:1920 length:1425 start_codon:yes stop_codon:yes gene_type:complete
MKQRKETLMNKQYLIESYIKNLRGLDKKQTIFDNKRPGLVLITNKQKVDPVTGEDVTKKSWYYNYRPKGAKPQRLFLGSADKMSRAAALSKIKKIENDIFNNEDPFTIRKKLKDELTLEGLINRFYQTYLLPSSYAENSIKSMKSLIRVWVLQRPNNPAEFNKYFTYSIKDKKISKIKKRDIQDMFQAAKSKSGYSANRLVAYLKIVFNWAIEENLITENPAKMKTAHLHKELESNEILSKTQYDNLLRLAFVVDERNGTINFDHYIQKDLDIISCLAISWCLLTGRRCSSEGFNIRFEQIDYNYKVIRFDESKVGQQKYKLSEKTLKLLNSILRSRQKNIVIPAVKYKTKRIPERIKPSPWANNDERREYIFPSKFFGSKSETPHIVEVRSTWKKLLKLCGINYIPLKQARHTFATLLLKKTKNLKVVQSQLGHAKITTSMKYAKLIDEDEFDAINLDEAATSTSSEVIEFKK